MHSQARRRSPGPRSRPVAACRGSDCLCVRVPVLSKITVSTAASRSSAAPSLTMTPAPHQKTLLATTCTTGTARPRAHGAGDDQDGNSGQRGGVPSAADGEPGGKCQRGQNVHQWGIDACCPVGQPHEPGLALFGRFHQPDDLGEEGVVTGGRHPDFNRVRSGSWFRLRQECRGPMASGAASPVTSERSRSLVPAITRPSAGTRSPAATATHHSRSDSCHIGEPARSIGVDDGGATGIERQELGSPRNGRGRASCGPACGRSTGKNSSMTAASK